jgi:AcrR family transcriptional regulator
VPPPPDSPKTTSLVQTARRLFLRHGIRRVSVEEICREANVSKRTFYQRFHNRSELAVRVLDELIERNRSRLESTLGDDVPLEDKVRRIIALKSGFAAEISADFYYELMTSDSQPGRFVRQRQREWDDRVRRFYAEAQGRGQIRADINVDLLMALLVRVRTLVEDEGLRQVEPKLSRLVESVMKLFFYGLVPRPDVPARAAPPRKGASHGG